MKCYGFLFVCLFVCFLFLVFLHTLDLGKAFSFWGLCPLLPTRDVAWFVPWKKVLKHSKEYVLSGYLKQDQVPWLRALTLFVDVVPRPLGGGGGGGGGLLHPMDPLFQAL